MPSEELGKFDIPSEAQTLTATYVALPWNEVKNSWAFTTYSPFDRPTAVIEEGPRTAPGQRKRSALKAVTEALSTGGLSLITKNEE